MTTIRLNANECLFLLIDIQESLFKAVQDRNEVELNCRLLLRLARILHIPVLATTQNAQKLGPLIPSLGNLLTTGQKIHDKLVFSCLDVPAVLNEIRGLKRKTLVLFGIEAHICVFQTAKAAKYHDIGTIIVATDAVSSRTTRNKETGLSALKGAGIELYSTEMIVYELLGAAGTPSFREMLPFLKDTSTA